MAGHLKRVSTHVLDTALGKPAVGVPVRLEMQTAGQWLFIATAETDNDGRCTLLTLHDDGLSAGVFRVVFDTDTYFNDRRVAGLYPVVEISFLVRNGESDFHIPLLLSPNGYTTYRGS
jgi:5-hydroxyisourate hydrolase